MSLYDQIQEVIGRSGAHIGVALRHIESGEELMIDADSYFPMASVFKVPVLVEACYRMAQNQFGLGDRWPLKTEDKNLPSGILTFLAVSYTHLTLPTTILV